MTRQLRGRETGSATTQLVLATPALLTLLMVTVHVGLWLHASHVAHAAAQEGARAARVETGSPAAGEARALDFLDSLGRQVITDREVTASRSPETARVEVTGYAAPVVPGFRLPVHAVAEGPVERFRVP